MHKPKQLIVLIGIFFPLISYSQSTWNEFTGYFPEIEIPFALDARIIKHDILISRNDAWKYIIRPSTKINPKKGKINLEFPIDSSLIFGSHQWDNSDLNKKDTIDIYSPAGDFRLSGLARFRINNNQLGIIYILSPGKIIDISSGSITSLWLFVYDESGEVIDNIELKGFSGGYSMCLSCHSYSICKVYKENDQIKIMIKSVLFKPINEEEYSPEAKMKTVNSDATFILRNDGIIKKN